MRRLAALLALLLAAAPAHAELYVVIVAGLGGEPQYQRDFDDAATALARAVDRGASASDRVTRLSGARATRAELDRVFRRLQAKLVPDDALAVFAIGHGSYDGEHYKFNVPGPDPSEEDWKRWLAKVRARSQLVVQATSASGALADALQAPGRVVVTATRTGMERNATVFGRYWAKALSDGSADLDKNGWISAREAFDQAARETAGFYAREVRLASEHPRIEGDGAGAFLVARVGAERPAPAAAAPADVARRRELLAAIDALRAKKSSLDVEAYYRELETLALELARLEQRAESLAAPVEEER